MLEGIYVTHFPTDEKKRGIIKTYIASTPTMSMSDPKLGKISCVNYRLSRRTRSE
jgi:hypothetical protein